MILGFREIVTGVDNLLVKGKLGLYAGRNESWQVWLLNGELMAGLVSVVSFRLVVKFGNLGAMMARARAAT